MSDRVKDNLIFHENASVSYQLLAADNFSATPSVKIAAKVGHKICVIKIAVHVFTDNAATQVWQDNTATPVKIAATKASPGLGPIDFDFGVDGYELPEGKSLDHSNSGAGLAAAVTITAYYKRVTGPNVPSGPA